MSAQLPSRITSLIDEANTHGWIVDEDSTPRNLPEGYSESVSYMFTRELPSGRMFSFVVSHAKRSDTGSWNVLRSGKNAVMGALFAGDGSARDKLAGMYGQPIEARWWPSVSDLRFFLALPGKVLALDWVGEAQGATS